MFMEVFEGTSLPFWAVVGILIPASLKGQNRID
jgi:hypothetical protein